jgi:hypothetical protein
MRSCTSITGFVLAPSFAIHSSREGLNPRAFPRIQPGPSTWDGHSQKRRLTMFDAFAYASALGRIRHVTALLISA